LFLFGSVGVDSAIADIETLAAGALAASTVIKPLYADGTV